MEKKKTGFDKLGDSTEKKLNDFFDSFGEKIQPGLSKSDDKKEQDTSFSFKDIIYESKAKRRAKNNILLKTKDNNNKPSNVIGNAPKFGLDESNNKKIVNNSVSSNDNLIKTRGDLKIAIFLIAIIIFLIITGLYSFANWFLTLFN